MCSAKIIEGSGGAQQEVVEEEEFLIDANEQFWNRLMKNLTVIIHTL